MKPNPPDSRSIATPGDADPTNNSPRQGDGVDNKPCPEWLIENAIDEIRNGRELMPDIAACLNKRPAVDRMRDRVKKEDVARLLHIIIDIINSSPESVVRCLMVSILQGFEGRPEVQTCLLDQWKRLANEAREPRRSDTQKWQDWKDQEEDIYRERHNLMWRIGGFREEELKAHGLFEQWQQFQPQAFDLIKSDWERFFQIQERFTGTGDRSGFRGFVEKRIRQIEEEHRFPQTKIWLYLCVASGASDRGWVRELLKTYEAVEDDDMEFVRQVATALTRPGVLPAGFPMRRGGPQEKAFDGIRAAFSKALQESFEPNARFGPQSSNDAIDDVCRRLFFEFGILQWEVMPRNLIQEYTQRDVANFHLLTGLLDRDDQLLIDENLHRAFALGRAYSPQNGSSRVQLDEAVWNLEEGGYATDIIGTIDASIPDCRHAFAQSLRKLNESHPEASKLVVQSWVNRMAHYESKVAVSTSRDHEKDIEQQLRGQIAYIHNGEMTFYSLLWTLRILKKKSPQSFVQLLRNLNSSENASRLPLIFNGEKWELATIWEWLLAMGLLLRKNGMTIATDRWSDFWRWLGTLNRNARFLTSERSAKVANEVDKAFHLPMKRLPVEHKEGKLWDWGAPWANSLWQFATDFCPEPDRYNNPVLGLSELLEADSFHTLISYGLENMKPMRSGPGKSVSDEEAALNDLVMNTVCRAAYLPAEYLLRQYQPYPLCLLTIAAPRVSTQWIDDRSLRSAPTALVFFTVAGDLGEPDFNCDLGPTRMSGWETMRHYWRLASLLNGVVSGYSAVAAVNDFWRTGQSVVFHDVSKDFNALDRQVYDFSERMKQVKDGIANAAHSLETDASFEGVASVRAMLSDTAAGMHEPRFNLLLRERFINSHIRAQTEGRFYEQPEECVALLRQGTHESLRQLVAKLVWLPGQAGTYEWARLFALEDDTGQEARVGERLKRLREQGVTDKRFSELFPEPNLKISVPTGTNGIWGHSRDDELRPPRLLPLFVFSMRVAYQNAFLTGFFDERVSAAELGRASDPQAITITSGTTDEVLRGSRDIDGIRIRFPTPPRMAHEIQHKATWHSKQSWERQLSVYRDGNLAYPWAYKDEIVGTLPNGITLCEITLFLV